LRAAFNSATSRKEAGTAERIAAATVRPLLISVIAT
jgi:hypothetical protein